MKSPVLIGAIGGFVLGLATLEPTRAAARHAQETLPKQENPATKPPAPKSAVLVPYFGNEKCPMEGQPVDRALFFEVDGQRVYACSAACVTTLKLDPAKALKQAYPEVKPIATRGCATCAAELEPGKSVDVTFQARSVKLCGTLCEKEFRQHPGVWLSRLTWPDVKDAGNLVCPIDDKAIDGVTVVIWKGKLVRLSSHACVATFEKDPDAAMAKIKTGG